MAHQGKPDMTETRRFGAYDVTRLIDGTFEAPLDVVIHTNGDAARSRALAAWGQQGVRVDVNCFLLRGPGGITLVDAGTGTAWGPALGHARARLAEHGITPEQIDRVLLTHLHGDHALGLLDGTAPYLPRAEILVPPADLAHFGSEAAREAAPPERRGAFDMTATLKAAYGDRLRPAADGTVLPGIESMPLPGHSPGHTGFLVQDPGRSLLLWGDTLHLSDLQPGEPEIGLVFDGDPAIAAATRRSTLEQAVRHGWIVAGGHISGFGQVVAAKKTGYRLALG
jgi:glyoxylase-like metal-dependent hydrolase (beta-lactamase superfamily II)